MARLTRKELKQDPFLSVYYDDFVEFAEKHHQKIIGVVIVAVLAFLVVTVWKRHERAAELNANALLGTALSTFNAYVGAAPPDALGPEAQTFPSTEDKYKAALQQFSEVIVKYPRQKAAEIALYHIGICQAQLGQQALAIDTLRKAANASDPEFASLSKFALADELARTGHLDEAAQIFRELAAHPVQSVPAATAWLALAAAERASNPAEARQIYQRLTRQAGSDTYLEEAAQQQLDDLPK